MKQSESFSSNYKALDKKFITNYTDSLQKLDSGAIHRLRVSIKRIKALFHLLEFVNHDFNADKSFRTYKEIFKQAGKARDLQVQLQLLSNLEKELKISLDVERRKIADKERETYRSYRKHCKKISPKFTVKINKRVLKVLENNFSVERAKRNLLRQLRQLKKLTQHNVSYQRDLHKLRILLKDYYYNIVLLNECALKDKNITKHIAMLHDLQDHIGKWHDRITMLRFAANYKHFKRMSPEEILEKRHMQIRLVISTQDLSARLRKRFPELLADIKVVERIL